MIKKTKDVSSKKRGAPPSDPHNAEFLAPVPDGAEIEADEPLEADLDAADLDAADLDGNEALDVPTKRSRSKQERQAQASTHVVTHAYVVGPYPKPRGQSSFNPATPAPIVRTNQARLDEAIGLAGAIDLEILGAEIVTLSDIKPASYIGKGKIEELSERFKTLGVELVMMDCALSPVQQRNLEKAFGTKVIDRTGLILEIFGRRARTREGSLQVELAHLAYQKSRLVRSWTHLERQRGGFGFLGGPGETQIETDRRLIQERITRIEQELEGVKKTRSLHRKSRRDVPYPIIALVGYTNAGKSTLFNRLTRADVLAKDMLFATLDPTLRAIKLPHGSKVILSDTVGFISDLPTMLISAFRATLEEVLEADIVVHVRDISHEDSEAQGEDVRTILKDLGVDPSNHTSFIEVWNKIDLLAAPQRETLLNAAALKPIDTRPFIVSALNGDGIDRLLENLEHRLSSDHESFEIDLDPTDGQGLHWLYEHTQVMARKTNKKGITRLTIRLPKEREEHMRHRFPKARAVSVSHT